jgi:hypothetical protein
MYYTVTEEKSKQALTVEKIIFPLTYTLREGMKFAQ